MTDEKIIEMANDWSVDYKPFETNLHYTKYAEYGFEQGLRRGLKEAITLSAARTEKFAEFVLRNPDVQNSKLWDMFVKTLNANDKKH